MLGATAEIICESSLVPHMPDQSDRTMPDVPRWPLDFGQDVVRSGFGRFGRPRTRDKKLDARNKTHDSCFTNQET